LMSEQPVESTLYLIFGPKEKPACTLRIKSHNTTITKAEDTSSSTSSTKQRRVELPKPALPGTTASKTD
jgi:hypothetical protein